MIPNLAAYNTHFAIGQSYTHQISHTKGFVADGRVAAEGSTNWSTAGEGTFVVNGQPGGSNGGNGDALAATRPSKHTPKPIAQKPAAAAPANDPHRSARGERHDQVCVRWNMAHGNRLKI